jgi:hypothetical protein
VNRHRDETGGGAGSVGVKTLLPEAARLAGVEDHAAAAGVRQAHGTPSCWPMRAALRSGITDAALIDEALGQADSTTCNRIPKSAN